jgi:hypothetical protein
MEMLPFMVHIKEVPARAGIWLQQLQNNVLR